MFQILIKKILKLVRQEEIDGEAKRPQTRGVAMNPVDHPHGGGEGKTSGGRSPVSPWGQSAKRIKNKKTKKEVTN